jgi:hypothetical protein
VLGDPCNAGATRCWGDKSGSDGTRTRDLCRDRALLGHAASHNVLILWGYDDAATTLRART